MEEKNVPDQKPILDPAHELPAPHDMELPPPHDMLLPQQHILHKHKWLFLLPALIGLIIGIIIGGVFLGGSNNEQKKINTTQTPTPMLSASPQEIKYSLPTHDENLTSEWLTYKDPNGLYSFKYPNNFRQSENFEGEYVGVTVGYMGPTQVASGRTQTALSDGASVSTLLITELDKTAKQLAEEMKEITLNSHDELVASRMKASTIQEVTLDGKLGYTFEYSGFGNGREIYLQLDNAVLRISYSYANNSGNLQWEYRNLSEKIISTFTFSPVFPTKVLNNSTGPSYCTQEVMVCPDGSSVSRIGPNCEFAPCTTQQP